MRVIRMGTAPQYYDRLIGTEAEIRAYTPTTEFAEGRATDTRTTWFWDGEWNIAGGDFDKVGDTLVSSGPVRAPGLQLSASSDSDAWVTALPDGTIAMSGPVSAPGLLTPARALGLSPNNAPEINYAAMVAAIQSDRAIQLEPGVYRISNSVTFNANVENFSLRGMGMGLTTIQFEQDAEGNGFRIGHSSLSAKNITFSDLTLSSVATMPAYGPTQYGLLAVGIGVFTIEDFHVLRCGFTCPDNCSNGVKSVLQTGCRLVGLRIEACKFYDISRCGIEIWSPGAQAYLADGISVVHNSFVGIGVKTVNLALAKSLAVSVVTYFGRSEIAYNYFCDIRKDAGGYNGSAIECSGQSNIHDNSFDQSVLKFSSILISNNNIGVRVAYNRDVGITTFGGFVWKIYDVNGPLTFEGNEIRGTVELRGGKNTLIAGNTMDTMSVGAGSGSAKPTNLYLKDNYMGLNTNHSTVINCSVNACPGWRITGNTMRFSGANMIDNPANLLNPLIAQNILNDVIAP